MASFVERGQCDVGKGRRARQLLGSVAGVALMAAATGGCTPTILSAVGPIADGDSLVLLDALGIMLVIVVPTILATLLFAWWFRASNKAATYRPARAYSGKLEALVWAIPDNDNTTIRTIGQ